MEGMRGHKVIFYIPLFSTLLPFNPGEAASSPQRDPGVNTQMMTSLPSPSTLSFLPLIDRVCVQCSQSLPRKGYQFTSQVLRVLTRVLISLPLVKVFFISVFIILVSLHCYLQLHAMLHLYVDLGKHNRDGLGRIQCLCSLSAGVPKKGTIMGSLNKKASGAQCFIIQNKSNSCHVEILFSSI